jgi:hypothetical protein
MPQYFLNPETEEIVTKTKSSKKCIFLGEFESKLNLEICVCSKLSHEEQKVLISDGENVSKYNYLEIWELEKVANSIHYKDKFSYKRVRVISVIEKTEQMTFGQEIEYRRDRKLTNLSPMVELADYFVSKCNEKNIKIESRAQSATDFGHSVYVYANGLKFRWSDHSVLSSQRIIGEIHDLNTVEKIDNYFKQLK